MRKVSTKKEHLALMVLMMITVTTGAVLASSVASADDPVVDEINITIPVSCTMSGAGMNTHNADIANGIYTSDIGTTTLHAFCNDNEGFAIYAAGYTGNEIGATNSNKLVGTSVSGNSVIESGIATSAGSPDVSNWAMKLAISQDSGDTTTNAFTIDSAPNVDLPSQAEQGATSVSFSDYHTVPNEYTKVAHKNSMTDMTATTGGVKLTTTYAAYISKTQPADTYSGQVIYTLVHPANAPTPVVQRSIDTATTLQDVTFCEDTLTEGQVYTLTDSRDNQQYKVAKLADGNCWMLDNLALDPTDPTTAANMNASNTNATAEAITNYLNGGNPGSDTGWSSTAVANVISDFNNNDYGFIQPRINNASKNTLVTSYGPASTNGQAKVGIYYNYCAATVGTYCYARGQGVDKPDTIIDANQDICPANWRMPTSGSTGEYFALPQKYSTDVTFEEVNSLQYNFSMPLSGYFSSSSVYGRGSHSNFWSSTFISGEQMYQFYGRPAYVYPAYYGYRYDGLPIRCLIGG